MSELTSLELGEQHVDLLPDREALALININLLSAVNTSLAVNAATVGSTAYANAGQFIFVSQR